MADTAFDQGTLAEGYDGQTQIYPENPADYSDKVPGLPLRVIYGFESRESAMNRASSFGFEVAAMIGKNANEGKLTALVAPHYGALGMPIVSILLAAHEAGLLGEVSLTHMFRDQDGVFGFPLIPPYNGKKEFAGIIVDNIRDTGKTEMVAKELITRTRPQIKTTSTAYMSTREMNSFVPDQKNISIFPRAPWITSGMGLDSSMFKGTIIGALERMSYLATIGDGSDWHNNLIMSGLKGSYYELLNETCLYNDRPGIKMLIIKMELERDNIKRIQLFKQLVEEVKTPGVTPIE